MSNRLTNLWISFFKCQHTWATSFGRIPFAFCLCQLHLYSTPLQVTKSIRHAWRAYPWAWCSSLWFPACCCSSVLQIIGYASELRRRRPKQPQLCCRIANGNDLSGYKTSIRMRTRRSDYHVNEANNVRIMCWDLSLGSFVIVSFKIYLTAVVHLI